MLNYISKSLFHEIVYSYEKKTNILVNYKNSVDYGLIFDDKLKKNIINETHQHQI